MMYIVNTHQGADCIGAIAAMTTPLFDDPTPLLTCSSYVAPRTGRMRQQCPPRQHYTTLEHSARSKSIISALWEYKYLLHSSITPLKQSENLF